MLILGVGVEHGEGRLAFPVLHWRWYCCRCGWTEGVGRLCGGSGGGSWSNAGRPAEALADAHVAGALAAPLAVGEGVEVGFLVGLARADVAAVHHEGGGGGGRRAGLVVYVLSGCVLGLGVVSLLLCLLKVVLRVMSPRRRVVW